MSEVDLEAIKADVKAAVNSAEQEEHEHEDVGTEDVQYTEAEQRAIEMGWNPDKEALDSDKEWVPAEEFLRNQRWVDEIKKLKREVRKQQKVTEAFRQQNEIAAKKAYQKAINDLTQAKRRAAQEEDLPKVLAIDERIDQLKEEQQESTAATRATATVHDWDLAFEEFVDNNSWYSDNRVMRAFADSVGVQYVKANPNATPDEVYEQVLSEVDREFKTKKGSTAQPEAKSPKAAAVASSSRRTAAKNSKHTINDIPEEHQGIARTLIKTGQITEEVYLKQYFPEDYS